MRDFFIKCFKDLHPLTGLRQYVDIVSNPEISAEYAQELIDELIEPMLEATQDFKYIPIPDQMKIIRRGILTTDRKLFYHLDAYMVRKWLQDKAALYFKEEAHQPTKPGNESNARPVTYDELSPETKIAFDNLMIALQSENAGFKSVPKVTERELKSIEIEDEIKRGQSTHSQPSDPMLIIQHEKKMKAIRDRGLDKVRDGELIRFEIEGKIVIARTEDEAREMYLEIYEA